MSTTVYFKQQPDIEFPEFLRELGFEDLSYGNDACARIERKLSTDGAYIGGWVEHANAYQREYGETAERYMFFLGTTAEDFDEAYAPCIYEGSDDAACAEAIRREIAERGKL